MAFKGRQTKTAASKSTEDKKSVKDILLDNLFKNLDENNTLPWSRGFVSGCINWATEREYRGVNLWLLQGGSGEYLTMNQLNEYNEKQGTTYKVKKGTKARYVLWCKNTQKEITEEEYEKLTFYEKKFCVKGDDGKLYRVFFTERFYKVFDIANVEDAEGNPLPSKIGTALVPTFSDSEQVIQSYCQRSGVEVIEEVVNTAYYTETSDTVHVPPRNRWDTAEARYRVIFHELTHSTGIKTRLARDCFEKYHNAKVERSKEELVAEFGSALLAGECGITNANGLDNSEAYVTSWGKWLKDNKDEIFSAMRMAEQAMRYILGEQVDVKDFASVDTRSI